MRCHISERDGETNPPAYNIWTSGTLQTPNILKSILDPSSKYISSFSKITALLLMQSNIYHYEINAWLRDKILFKKKNVILCLV